MGNYLVLKEHEASAGKTSKTIGRGEILTNGTGTEKQGD